MKTKLVPATTNNITKAIIAFLNSKGHFAFRVNTTGTYDPFNKTFRKIAKENRGCPDILACMQWPNSYNPDHKLGIFWGFEIKNSSTKDRVSEDQQAFHSKVEAAGGRVLIVNSYKQFIEWYSTTHFRK